MSITVSMIRFTNSQLDSESIQAMQYYNIPGAILYQMETSAEETHFI